MKSRCENANRPDFVNYGGRGITVCREWARFEVFLADMGEPPVGLTLDRIVNSRGYSKANCRWATRITQRRNRRDTVNDATTGLIRIA